MNSEMKYNEIVNAAVTTVLLIVIVFFSTFHKSITDEDGLTLKRNAILEYLKENDGTNSSKGFNQDIVKSHRNALISKFFKNLVSWLIPSPVIQDRD